MKHILLLSMGGTIASVSNGEGLEPQFSPTEMIRLIPQLNGLCQISYLEVASLDRPMSSLKNGNYWLAPFMKIYHYMTAL